MSELTTHTAIRSERSRTSEPLLRAMLELANELRDLHRSGRIHRDISLQTVVLDLEVPQARLSVDVSVDAISFGGFLADSEHCPPELRRSQVCEIPPLIDDARRVLAAQEIVFEPQRIDLYQFGALLCRHMTGRSIQAYLSSPGVVFRVPARVRQIIDGCIGYDEALRIESADRVIDLLNGALGATPATEGSLPSADRQVDTHSDLRAETHVHLRRLPFDRLGHFEIQEDIGRGGMGTVYRAYDRSLDRVVAVKVLSQRLASDPAFVKRFQAEAAAAARLTHPNVVPIYFIGEDAGRHFYTMRFINGESLADRLHREPSLSASEVLIILQQVLLGLAAAHRMGLVHRDIKPGNILIDRENGLAMLTDFGLALSTSQPHEQSENHLVMGTAEYMSPEQAQGDPVDPRSDLYSVGVLLYQLLSGDMPFDANTPSRLLVHHVCSEPRPLRESVPDIDPQLEAVVLRLLRKRPSDRYPSVEELLIDLDVAMDYVFASSADTARPVASVGAARSSRIRRLSSEVRRRGQTLAETAPSSPSRISDATSEARKAATETAMTVTSPRRKVALAVAGTLAVLLAIASAMIQPQAAATSLQSHQDAVSALAFSPDGKWLLSGGGASSSLKAAGDTSLRLWNAHSGQLVKQSDRLPVRPRQLVFLEDSQRAVVLASAHEDASTLVVWDTRRGTLGPTDFSEPFTMHFDSVPLHSGNRDQALLAAGRNGLTRVTIAGVVSQTSSVRTTLDSATIRAFTVCHTMTGPQVLVAIDVGADTASSTIVSLDLQTGRELTRLQCGPGVITALAASRDGRSMVTRATERLPRPNGNLVEPTDSETAFDFVRVWDTSQQVERFCFGPYAPGSRALAVTSDGRRALTIAEPSIGPRTELPQDAVWLDLTTGQEICRVRTNSKSLTAVALSSNGTRAAIADAEGQVVFCDLPK